MNKSTRMFVIGVAVGFAANYAWNNYSRPLVAAPAPA